MIIVTGGAGFIGSNFILNWLNTHDEPVLNLDALTYAGNPENLKSIVKGSHYQFVKGDIGDAELVGTLLKKHKPRAILNLAAESHVDRSIHGPRAFIQTNIVGTFELLEQTRIYFNQLSTEEKDKFRFLHVSTDEVYGSLKPHDPAFSEETPFAPNSPYSASKASSDFLVRSYHHTYGLPVLTTNCSNNYGPFQFPEKLIPLMIHNALNLKPLPIYGDGLQIRDWLYVVDHTRAIEQVLEKGIVGETYNIGGNSEKPNIQIVEFICKALDQLKPRGDGKSYLDLKTYVTDRPGHDRRYAVNASKIASQIGWVPQETFESGMMKTISWYLANLDWVANVTSGHYQKWVSTQYQGSRE